MCAIDVAEGDAEDFGTGNGAHPAERFTAQRQPSSCFVGPIHVFGRGCQMALCHLEGKLGKPSEPRSGSIGLQQCRPR